MDAEERISRLCVQTESFLFVQLTGHFFLLSSDLLRKGMELFPSYFLYYDGTKLFIVYV